MEAKQEESRGRTRSRSRQALRGARLCSPTWAHLEQRTRRLGSSVGAAERSGPPEQLPPSRRRHSSWSQAVSQQSQCPCSPRRSSRSLSDGMSPRSSSCGNPPASVSPARRPSPSPKPAWRGRRPKPDWKGPSAQIDGDEPQLPTVGQLLALQVAPKKSAAKRGHVTPGSTIQAEETTEQAELGKARDATELAVEDKDLKEPAGPVSKRALRRALQSLRQYCPQCSEAISADKMWERCRCGQPLSAPQVPRHAGKDLARKAKVALRVLERHNAEQDEAASSQGLRATAQALRAQAHAVEARATLRDAAEALQQAEEEARVAVQAAPRQGAAALGSPGAGAAPAGPRASAVPRRGWRNSA